MRILLTGGGTGGHVYPALSAAEALCARAGAPVELLFAGTVRGDVERLAAAAGIPFAAVRAAPVRGRAPWQLARSAWELTRGTAEAWRLLGRFRPWAVLATGGYAGVPVSVAARLRGVPLVLYLPDVRPGWAVRFLARLARRIAVTSEGSLAYLPRGKTCVTGYPVRAAFFSEDRGAARQRLGFADDLPLLLVTGATQGARAINRAVLAALPALLPRCAVLHQTGADGLAEAQRRAAALPDELRERYRPVAYLDAMPAAMAAADLAVMRAGASALAEPAAAGLPAVLVPGTFAGAHQRANAAFMQARGAAVMLPEAELPRLADTVLGLLNDRARLCAMREAAHRLARPDAAQAIAAIVLEATA
ncbi:MAG TPA: UDP-N-acetylglucosamine--N-acetylmuramyl-(pentapeptide) pyrophosphoryl-undecaprenol N-acetylglucosamine transferase [Dehalococcoidia bacterium]|nr:UDP-N-acetylglucosamine--N-acetylmuramyl-(pentapeptide) pyrophosphoryl-undecaprenol N-acetylglucosamine transferase [Dehalococcoidia bacterium]